MTKILFIMFSLSAIAAPPKRYPWMGTLSQKKQTYRPATPSDLLEFSFVEAKKKVLLDPGDDYAYYMTSTRAVLKTDTVKNIENYVIVQYIRGCMFEAVWDGKTIEYRENILRDFFGTRVPFKHKEFVIDSDNADPALSSYEGYGRFALLRWNKNPNSLETENATYYALKKPRVPVVFTSDIPGAAVRERNNTSDVVVTDTSLEFKICLFHAADVPAKTDPQGTGLDVNRAIRCFEWEHKFTYDFQKAKFITGGPLHPVCTQ